MIFDKYGLPRDAGATDSMDSCRLAGVMTVFGHPQAPIMYLYAQLQVKEATNLDTDFCAGVRHPMEYPSNNANNFTRDQLIPLVAGLRTQGECNGEIVDLYRGAMSRYCRAQNTEYDVPGSTKKFPNGADILSPHNMLVLARAAGVTNYFWEIVGRLWAVLDIAFNAVFTPTREPNQLLCSLMVLGPRWMKFYKLVTPKWRQALRDYWSGWRGEAELAEWLIVEIDKI